MIIATVCRRTNITAAWLVMVYASTSFGQVADQSISNDQVREQTIHVVVLSHVLADDIVAAIRELDLPVWVSATEGNRLVLRGLEKNIEYVMDTVISQLDAPSTANPVTTAIFKLNNEPTADLIAALHQAAPGQGVRVGLHKLSRTLAVHGNQESVKSIESFLAQADAPRHPITLDIFFLRGLVGTSWSRPPDEVPTALQTVVAPLAENGFVDLAMLAPIQVRTNEGESFDVESSMKIGEDVDHHDLLVFSVHGFASVSSPQNSVSISIEAQVKGIYKTGGQTHFEVATNLVAKSGDYTVLSAAPSSAFSGEVIVLVVRATRG